MGEFVVDITGLDAFAKELLTFSDTLATHASTFDGNQPDPGQWAGEHTASARAATTPFQDHVATLVDALVTQLASHATYVSECVTAYNTSDASVSSTFTPEATGPAPEQCFA